jgi:hypothetical protein
MKLRPPVYILYYFVLICLLQSCSRNDDMNPPDEDITKPKRRLLTRADGSTSSNDSPAFYYDSSGKLIRITFSFAFGQIDVHHNNDTISHLIFPFRDINSAHMSAAAIFYYRPDKKIERVIYTPEFPSGTENTAISAAKTAYYVGGPGGPVRVVDSIVYTPTGQLSEIWTLRVGQGSWIKFIYDNAAHKSPSRIQHFEINQAMYSDVVLTTSNMENPAYKACWFLPFISELMHPYVHGGLAMPITPHINHVNSFVWALVPDCIIRYSGSPQGYISPVFTYEYNQDSTVFTGKILGDVDGPFNRFRYFFELK